MRKIIAVLVSMFMFISMIPVFGSAAEIVDSGTCGDHLNWTLDIEGTLTVNGTGAMSDYSYMDDDPLSIGHPYTTAPWGGSLENGFRIKRIIIESGVTGIGNNAFSGCGFLENLTIADSVTSIGNNAFFFAAQGSDGITNVTIPNSVTSIGEEAFAFTPIHTLTIGSGLTTIPVGAFHISSPGSVDIPFTVQSIEDYAFGYYNIHSTDHDGTGNEIRLYNPNCVIADRAFDVYSYLTPEPVTLYGYEGSTAQTFAQGHALTFIPFHNSHTHVTGNPEETVITPADCGNAGEKKITVRCSVCGDTLSETTAEIPATGEHTAGLPVEKLIKAPTCTEKGAKLITVKCSVCGDTLSETTAEIPATGEHTAGLPAEKLIKAPTCTEKGAKLITVKCSVCGELLNETTEEIAETEHIDANNDGKCDVCRQGMPGVDAAEGQSENVCKWCCKVHDNSFIGRITKALHSIAYFLAHLFGQR